MTFTSVTFWLFLPVVFALHWAGRGKRWQNVVLLAASYVFYGWWDWRFLGLLVATSLVDYTVALGFGRWDRKGARRLLLWASLLANLGVLAVFKYFNFFADSLAVALSLAGIEINTTTLTILLPIGISFYTFQTLSYTVDVYRGHVPAQRDLLAYLTYVSFFPQLVAGPIERARHLLPQFERARDFSEHDAADGCRLMLWGFAKKMLLADNLALLVEEPYGAPASASGASLFLATIAFAFQIYADFSGYSDIAAGAARLFGVQLMRNFNYPYFAQSLTEFWRRWHISLSTWFRDYVYIPMGGNRDSRFRTARNLMLTALVSGLWHGAAWHFVVWGALHGAGLGAERLLGRGGPRGRLADIPGGDTPSVLAALRMLRTFGIVALAWVFFRADNLSEAGLILRRMAGSVADGSLVPGLWQLSCEHAWLLGLWLVFVGVEWWNRRVWTPSFLEVKPRVLRWAAYTALVWLVALYGTRQTAAFIYFQF